jgi:hypothetical protein
LSRINFLNAASQRMRGSLTDRSADQLMSALVDGHATPASRDAVQSYARQHPGDRAPLLFMTMATPEFQLE